MKKQLLLTVINLFFAVLYSSATVYTVSIIGTSYSPSTVNAVIGDSIVISASGIHPLVQVDQTTWNASGITPMSGGWGVKTAQYGFKVTSVGNIYFLCQNHGPMGMKGTINVTATSVNNLTTKNNNVSVFSNPLVEEGNITVSINQPGFSWAKIDIYNVTGQMVQSEVLSATTSNIGTVLPGGIYYYSVGDDKNNLMQSGKFLLVR